MEKLSSNWAAIILAAGKGTRMRSEKPKVLHTLLGEPMLAFVLSALEPLFADNIFIVAGHKADMVRKAFPEGKFVIQSEQLGTGHALLSALPELKTRAVQYALVVNGDVPMLAADTVEKFIADSAGADVAFATITLEDSGAYGRVIRDNGEVRAIVEAKDFDPAIHGEDRGEVNAGLYLLRLETAAPLLELLKNDNKSGEYYITDLVGLAKSHNLNVKGICLGADPTLLGINSPLELSRMEESLREKIANELLMKGVILHAPHLVRASPFSSIEPGAEITGPCEISGKSVIHTGAVISSHCLIHNSEISQNALARSFSHLDNAFVGPNAQVGPYTRLRPGAALESDAHAGNFVELKNAALGRGAKANHLTYLGDAHIGAGANIGAGTITCNYDGKNKFKTNIGEKAFIGSNSALVAPVDIGDGALVGAGSVITKDVPPHEMAIARGRQVNMPKKIA